MTKHTILFLAANPLGTDHLALDREAHAIQTELGQSEHRDQFDLVTRWAAEPLDLLRELRKLKPTIVHFSGHGSADERAARRPDAVSRRDVDDAFGAIDRQPGGGLYFQGPDGRTQIVSTAALKQTFGAAADSVRLVVLSACYSEAQAEALLAHVECVVGMSGSITDDAARSFAIGFYGGLGERESVARAFEQGRAAISLGALRDSDRPQLKVRNGVNAGRVVLAAPSSSHLRLRRQIFTMLFAAVAGFAILFGAGVLHQNVVSEYVVFVLLGALAAVLTWGILSSTGEINRLGYGIQVKLAGAFVPLVLITGGGLWMMSSDEAFEIKFKLVNGAGQPVKVSGTARLEVAADPRRVVLQNTDLVAFHLPHADQDKDASLTLESSDVQSESPEKLYRLHPNELFLAHVVPVSITKISGTVSCDQKPLPSGTISVTGRDCSGNIQDGFFEIPCDGLSAQVQIEIRLPDPYAKDIRTRTLNKLLGEKVSLSSCSKKDNGSPPPPRLCFLNGKNLPKRWTSKECANPPKPEHKPELTEDYKRLFPKELRECDDLFIYTCP